MMITDGQPTKMVLDETTEFTDMVVIIGDTRIPCHKAVVCRYSIVINLAMTTNMKEGITGEFAVNEEDVHPEEVHQFLLAMYNPWDPATMDPYVIGIYRLARVYQSLRVKNMAVQVLGELLKKSVKTKEPGGLETTSEATLSLSVDEFTQFTKDEPRDLVSDTVIVSLMTIGHYMVVRGINWRFHIRASPASTTDVNVIGDLGCHVDCLNTDKSLECDVQAVLRIVSQDESMPSYERSFKACFTGKSKGWGYPKMMNFNEILDPKNSYCKDDTVVIEVDMTVNTVVGLPKSFWTIASAYDGQPCPELLALCADYLAKDPAAGYYFSDDRQFKLIKENYPQLVAELACPVAARAK